jgi:hypothetical protein
MPVLIFLILASFLLAAFDVAVNQWGADSRPSLGDDHAR